MLLVSPEKVFLFQRYLNFCVDFKVIRKNIIDTKLASYFTKVTARPSFTELRVSKRDNK